MIECLDLLTSDECTKVNSIVHSLKTYWLRRNFLFPFYTLGIPSYMDADPVNLEKSYLCKVSSCNKVLSENLGWMYAKLAECLSAHLCAPVELHTRYSLPGFHIYLYDEFFSRDDLTSSHFDLQFKVLQWDDKVDFGNSLSLTMPVTLPHDGGGMFYWDMLFAEAEGWDSEQVERIKQSKTRNFCAYEPGKIVLHVGNFLHQAAPYQDPQPDDERITLQGHMAFYRGSWHLYW